ncbi:hypothetical protein [Jiangella aurantiaca]|nr:hypothetical protein [Jiangella aurantiaca]
MTARRIACAGRSGVPDRLTTVVATFPGEFSWRPGRITRVG